MQEFDRECLQAFLEGQYKLFGDNVVVRTMGETKEFLQDNFAVVVNSKEEVKKYFEENGGDVSGMTLDEIIEQSEVFALKKTGRYLIVEA